MKARPSPRISPGSHATLVAPASSSGAFRSHVLLLPRHTTWRRWGGLPGRSLTSVALGLGPGVSHLTASSMLEQAFATEASALAAATGAAPVVDAVTGRSEARPAGERAQGPLRFSPVAPAWPSARSRPPVWKGTAVPVVEGRSPQEMCAIATGGRDPARPTTRRFLDHPVQRPNVASENRVWDPGHTIRGYGGATICERRRRC